MFSMLSWMSYLEVVVALASRDFSEHCSFKIVFAGCTSQTDGYSFSLEFSDFLVKMCDKTVLAHTAHTIENF